MDIFKFQGPTDVMKLEYGIFINDIKSAMWVERYRDAGEFQIIVPAESAVRKQLTIGSFISHVKTPEVMVVENHEIRDDKGKPSDLVITGRSFETILDTRIVGGNKTFPVVGEVKDDYNMGAMGIWQQALSLVQGHIYVGLLINANDEIPYTTASLIGAAPTPSTSEARIIKRGSLYTRVLELLEIDNLGIRVVRPGQWPAEIGPSGSVNTLITVHAGIDRRTTISLAYNAGEIESSDYLWSNRNFKNAAYVTTKWVQTFTFTSGIKSYRRTMWVNASDLDDDLTAAPTGTALSNLISAAQRRGLEVLKSQHNVTLTKAEVSKEYAKYKYRTDYNVGDLVYIHGDYNAGSVMRVSEFVEIEDETGEYGYPTFTLLEES